MRQTDLARGRSHTKIEQEGVKRTIKENHGQPLLYLPKALLDIGLALNQEVIIVATKDPNFLSWEIKIKPLPKKESTDDI